MFARLNFCAVEFFVGGRGEAARRLGSRLKKIQILPYTMTHKSWSVDVQKVVHVLRGRGHIPDALLLNQPWNPRF